MYKSGDHFVCGNDLYGGVPAFLIRSCQIRKQFTYVDIPIRETWNEPFEKHQDGLYRDPANPLMSLSDIGAISQMCRRKKAENWWSTTLSCRHTFRQADLARPTWWFTPLQNFLTDTVTASRRGSLHTQEQA